MFGGFPFYFQNIIGKNIRKSVKNLDWKPLCHMSYPEPILTPLLGRVQRRVVQRGGGDAEGRGGLVGGIDIRETQARVGVSRVRVWATNGYDGRGACRRGGGVKGGRKCLTN